jgi:hypothetical protein
VIINGVSYGFLSYGKRGRKGQTSDKMKMLTWKNTNLEEKLKEIN